MICSNCNNGCKKCGCKDTFVEAAPSTPTCEVVQCAAVMDANCVIYSGSPIVSGDTTIVNTGDTVSEALNEIVTGLTLPYKYYIASVEHTDGILTVSVKYNNLGTPITWSIDGSDCNILYATLTTPTLEILAPFISPKSYNISYSNYTMYADSLNDGTTIQVDIKNPSDPCPMGSYGFYIEIKSFA
jgi:hypothetical protein